MEIAFDARSLRSLCENEAHAERQLGLEVAEMLRHRLADLRAATSAKDLVAGLPRELDGVHVPSMAIRLCRDQRIVFCANHRKNPKTKTGRIDWSRVRRIRVVDIGEDHD